MFKKGDKVMRYEPIEVSGAPDLNLDIHTVYTIEYTDGSFTYFEGKGQRYKGQRYSYFTKRFFKVKEETTPWFPADVKPTIVGWYDTSNPYCRTFTESDYRWWWDGGHWMDSPGRTPSDNQNRMWRGITYVKGE